MNKKIMFTIESPYCYLLNSVKQFSENIALVSENRKISYKQLYKYVISTCEYFQKKGIKKKSIVTVYTDDLIEMVVSAFSLWRIGAVFSPINISQKDKVIKEMESLISPDFGIFSNKYEISYERIFNFIPIEINNNDCVFDYSISVFENELAMILFTSGSSGIPKAVPVNHIGIYHNTKSTADILRINYNDRLFINTPPYTTSTLVHILTLMSKSASIAFENGFFFGNKIISLFEKYSCTGFGGVPVHFLRISEALETVSFHDSFRFLMNSGDHLSELIIKKIRSKAPKIEIFCAYGLTEVSGRFCILDSTDIDNKVGSVGKPIPDMFIEIKDENNNVLNAYEEGEVFAMGKCLMDGYLFNEDINKKLIINSSFATGDIGYIDTEGYLYLKGRKDDIFKVGGEKVSIKMIESIIVDYSDFEEFMVCVSSDKVIGNIPVLYYVIKEGKQFNNSNFILFLRTRLPENHIPKKIIKVNKIPKTESGKIIRKEIIE